ncbi:MAG: class 1 isoprenoid biosynthesis enzyme [Anaerohalosphaeraceae bacterium]
MTTTTLLKRISIFAEMGLKNPRLIALLTKAASEYRQVESEWEMFLREFRFSHNAHFINKTLSSPAYFEKNFFSILLLSILISAQIPKYRRLKYGLMLQALRTIVTCTDNILDHEQKGAVRLETKLNNPVLDNVLLTLAAQKVLLCASCGVCSEPYGAERLQKQLLDSLFAVAQGESAASLLPGQSYPEPDEIIETVHKKIGGQLLGLALIAPMENESEYREALDPMERGILAIGTALQMLDDITDIVEDWNAGKKNYLASWIMYHSPVISMTALNDIVAGDASQVALKLGSNRIAAIDQAIHIALEGFDLLHRGGYPVNHEQALSLLRVMFRLRGLGTDWEQSSYAH